MYNKELIHVDCSTKPLRSELLVGCEQSLASRFRVTLQVTCMAATNSKAFSCNVIVWKTRNRKKKSKMVMQRGNTKSQTINNLFYKQPRNHCMRNNWTIINQCTRNFSSWSEKKLPCANLDDGIPFLLRSTRTFSPTCL